MESEKHTIFYRLTIIFHMINNNYFTQNNMIFKNINLSPSLRLPFSPSHSFLTKLTFSASSLLKALSTSRALNGAGPFESSGIL